MTYNQYPASPSGMNYLTGDVQPWEDYLCFRSDEDTSVCVYGLKSAGTSFSDATVRTVRRTNSVYQVTEQSGINVDVNISYPYYAYGNIIGNNYNLPSYNAVTSVCASGFFILAILISVFRLVWSLKGGIK